MARTATRAGACMLSAGAGAWAGGRGWSTRRGRGASVYHGARGAVPTGSGWRCCALREYGCQIAVPFWGRCRGGTGRAAGRLRRLGGSCCAGGGAAARRERRGWPERLGLGGCAECELCSGARTSRRRRDGGALHAARRSGRRRRCGRWTAGCIAARRSLAGGVELLRPASVEAL